MSKGEISSSSSWKIFNDSPLLSVATAMKGELGEEMVSKQSYEFCISTSHLGLCPKKEQYPVRESNTHIYTVPSGFSVSGLGLLSQNSARRAEKFLFLCVWM